MQLVTEWFATFLVDRGQVKEVREFPRDAMALAERLHALDRGEVLEEERALAGGEALDVAEPRLLTLPGARLARSALRLRDREAEHGFGPELFRGAMLELAKRRTRASMGGRDQHVVQAVQASDDLAETANILAERLREWYGLHFPEADRLIERHEELATLISSHVTRQAILEASPHVRLDGESMGAELGAEEQAMVRGLAKALSSLYAQRAELDRYLDAAMPGIAPNVTALVGPAVAARLLFHAGGLPQLAKMSSGTIQTLGAEKALFRHLKEGNRPPKHGVLFQHPLIHRSPPRQRGALARALAGKVAIAARADAFTHREVATGLQATLDKRVAGVRSAGPRKVRPGPGPLPPARAPSRAPAYRPPSSGPPPPQRAPYRAAPPRAPPPERAPYRPPSARAAPPRAPPPPPRDGKPGFGAARGSERKGPPAPRDAPRPGDDTRPWKQRDPGGSRLERRDKRRRDR